MTHASLFSGIGGAELAAEWMGWQNLFHCEINPFCRKVLEYHYPDSTSYEDITTTDFTPWRGRVDVLTGGFPCQPFSLAGQRRGADDDRYLWPQMLRAVREIRPAWVVGENVAGILTMVQPGKELALGSSFTLFGKVYRERVLLRQQFTLEAICAGLEREGYAVQPFVIPACAVGAPHRRDRVWIVARRDGGVQPAPVDAHLGDDTREPGEYAGEGGKERLQERDETLEPGEPGDVLGLAAHADRKLLEYGNSKGYEKRSEQGLLFESQGCQGFWRDFPTQPPVCRGDDGISARLAGITFPRWRAESVKALGNAWVPQVAYEIFCAIEKN